MVTFNVGFAFLAGFVGTVAMSLAMNMAKAAGMTRMPPFPLIMGGMMTGDRRKATVVGAFAHYIVMGTVVFGLVYAALFTAFDTASWLAGLLIGAVHGLVIGLIAMPMMPGMHPRMEPELAGAAGGTVIETGGEVRVVAPGVMGSHWGGVTPLGVLMGHLIYGIVVALVYGALL